MNCLLSVFTYRKRFVLVFHAIEQVSFAESYLLSFASLVSALSFV